MSNPEIEKENAYYRGLAQFEEVDKIRLGLHGFTPDQFQERYLELWKHFLAENPRYLYPDDLSSDVMMYDEYVPHPEGSTAQSYPNVERLLGEAREERAEGLTRHYSQMRQNGSPRQVLAERLLNMAARIEEYTILQELSGNRHKVELPTWPADGSEPPQQVGLLLADLAHFLEVHEAFLAAEVIKSDSRRNEPEQNLKAGKYVGRDDANLDDFFSFGFKTSHCDILAKSLDLCPPDEDFESVANANTKLWILVDAIKSDPGYSTKTANKLAKVLGRRYGYTVADKLTNKSKNSEYSDSIPLVRNHINRMEKEGKFK